MNKTQIRFLRRYPLFLRLAIMAAASLVVLGGLIALIAWQWYQLGLRPVDVDDTSTREFVVERGQSSESIAEALEDRDLIKSAFVFDWYVRVNDHYSDFQSGNFEIARSMSVSEIVDVLKDGQASSNRVTIYPDLRLDEIFDSLVDQGFSRPAVTDALDARRHLDHPVAEWWPKEQPPRLLEGYLYPETFNVTGFETEDLDSVVRRSLNEFAQVFKDNPNLESGLAAQGLTVHQGVILASIVAQEASDPEDMAKIAQVFLKRYNQGASLGADPPFFYAFHVLGTSLDFDVEHPYNTRKVAGLPPGPIANFKAEALLAVANPADTNYYFFVAGDDGTIHFNETLAGHNRDANLYCHEACRLPTAGD